MSVPAIILATPFFVPIEVFEDLNMPLVDTGTTFPKVVIFTTEVSYVVIVLISLSKVTIFVATSEPSEAAPLDPWVLTDVFPIISVAKAIPAAST